jgi:hypothetical protein
MLFVLSDNKINTIDFTNFLRCGLGITPGYDDAGIRVVPDGFSDCLS